LNVSLVFAGLPWQGNTKTCTKQLCPLGSITTSDCVVNFDTSKRSSSSSLLLPPILKYVTGGCSTKSTTIIAIMLVALSLINAFTDVHGRSWLCTLGGRSWSQEMVEQGVMSP
jgi:hypothetical protein